VPHHVICQPTRAGSPRRRYVSPKRAEAALRTRQAIRDAAETLFLRDGYSRTSMKAIAKHAGVSEKTMYLAFATKAALLLEVVQVAVRGDETPGPLANRPEWRALLSGPADEMIARFAALSAKLMAGTAALIALGEAAADVDAELAVYRDLAHEANRDECKALAIALEYRGALAPEIDVQGAADIVYALAGNENIYLRLTRECGWTEARYADLIACTLEATIGRRGPRLEQ
jgi:AcrR family transcriptional regulator